MAQVHIDVGHDPYDIFIGQDLNIGELIRNALPKTKDVMIVSNTKVAPLYLQEVSQSLAQSNFNCKSCILADGEAYKNVDSYMKIMSALIHNNFARDCALIALGGGVIGDITGFVASTYQRGVSFVQIPTTLLAMVDSSVGGKTAINHPQGKNMIGSFYQPQIVIANLNFLKTLPSREMSAGMAEVIKYGVILDREFFDYIFQHNIHTLDLEKVVVRCCELKAQVVSQDEKENGLRAILNYGHTFGHAIEVGMGFGTYLHGEAVAIGMLIAAFVAYKTKNFSKDEFKLLRQCIHKYDLPFLIPEQLTGDIFISHMRHDKKVKSGKINYILPYKIGESFVCNEYEDYEIVALIDKLHALCNKAKLQV